MNAVLCVGNKDHRATCTCELCKVSVKHDTWSNTLHMSGSVRIREPAMFPGSPAVPGTVNHKRRFPNSMWTLPAWKLTSTLQYFKDLKITQHSKTWWNIIQHYRWLYQYPFFRLSNTIIIYIDISLNLWVPISCIVYVTLKKRISRSDACIK